MKRLVIICPDCGDSIIIDWPKEGINFGGFNSACGTLIEFKVDNRYSHVNERLAWLKERAQNVRVNADTAAARSSSSGSGT